MKTPDDVSIAPETFKDHLNTSNFQNWKCKPLHGQYVSNLYDNNCAHSLGWLAHSDLTESLILAAQDQALNTKYYNATILGGSDSSCCLCGSENRNCDAYCSWLPCIRSAMMKLVIICTGACALSLDFQWKEIDGSIIPDLSKSLIKQRSYGILL